MIKWWQKHGRLLWKIMFWANVGSTCLTLFAGDLRWLPFDLLLVGYTAYFAFGGGHE